jgi:TolB protein
MTMGIITAVTSAGGAPCCVDWSPDGTQFVFASRDAGTYDLYLATVDGSYVAQLTRGLGDEINPVWNPRGNVIVFQSVENGVSQLFTIRTNGEDVTQLTNSGNNVEPSWSADGQVILFSTNRNGQNYEIYAMNADGSNQRGVSGTGGQNALGATPR